MSIVLLFNLCFVDCNPPCTAAQVCTINGDCICPAGTLPGTTPGVCEPFNSGKHQTSLFGVPVCCIAVIPRLTCAPRREKCLCPYDDGSVST